MKNRLTATPALVIAHPGHELRIHGWLETVHPTVFVLTDGSGRSGHSRLNSTTQILRKAGARTGSLYGRFTDSQIYAAILRGDIESFTQVVLQLGEAFWDEEVEYVVADAAEGFNPCHDLCRYLVDTTVAWVAQKKGRTLANYDFLLEGRPDSCSALLREQAIHLALDESGFQRKVQAVSNYPELKDETQATVARFGPEVFRTECLRPVSCGPGQFLLAEEPPYYERYGEQQVASGFYTEVIRYRHNVLPLVQAVWRRLELETEDRHPSRLFHD
jgi:AcrR family transcriptional regulator